MTDSFAPAEPLDETTYCYGHPDTPTRLRCSRCDRPICGRCAIPASVGQHCPECVAEARRGAPRVRPVLRATAPVVAGILAANVLIYLAQQIVPGVTSRFASIPLAVAEGQYYRLFTAMFLHAPGFIMHILFNMLVLWSYGPHVEQAYGSARFAVIYVLGGLAGSVASFAFGACTSASVGASGAIFGMVGALVAYLYSRRSRTFVRQHLNGLLMFIAINVVIGFVLPNIDYMAHLGGLLGGAALGFAFDPELSVGGRNRLPVQLVAAAVMIVAGASVVAWRATNFSCFG